MGIVLSINTFLQEYFNHTPNQNLRNATTRVTVGKVVALGGGLVCLLALLSPKDALFDRAAFWPASITKRVQDTYFYYGCSVVVSFISMACFYQSGDIVEFLTSNTPEAVFAASTVVFITGCIVNQIPYTEDIGAKQIALIMYATTIGAVVSPICHLGGPVVVEAAWLTAVIVTELCLASAFVSTEVVFHILVAPILIGYMAVDISTIVGFFFPPPTSVGARAHQINLYGGTVVFAGLLFVCSHLIYVVAEILKEEDPYLYDPINAGLLIFFSTSNLFVRVAVLLAYEDSDSRNVLH